MAPRILWDEHKGRGIPTSLTPVSGRLAFPPSRSASRSTHLGWGTRRHSLVGSGTPRSRNADNDGQRGAAALYRVQVAIAMELVVHSGTCGHVGLFLEVELTVVKFLLVVDERSQRECLLLMVFVWGFQEIWIHIWRWFIKMTHKSDPWKKYYEE
jgi:heme/copper-type cytochrome/quinol oxidase subunit 4